MGFFRLDYNFSKVEQVKIEHNKSSHTEAFSFDKYVYPNSFHWYLFYDIWAKYISWRVGWVDFYESQKCGSDLELTEGVKI